ncbi:hypothetical protein [Cellulomonas timonensis]|uniref:hypothetical protein n=1 Tax=Cellulomonas timonensis TaxID=1689271 RepID=UPI00082C7F5A|nr:hypothetical protein [Cellulomonas timonensis]
MPWPISADDVRTELKWPAHTGEGPDPVAIFATGACARIEAEIGPRSGHPVLRRSRGPASAVVLPWPAATLVSVTVGGVELDVGLFDLDGPAGIVYGRFGRGAIVVTATAPNDGVPEFVELAARVLAATWVKQSKVGPPTARSRGTEPDGSDVLQGFAMPRRVSEMIRPEVPSGGFG